MNNIHMDLAAAMKILNDIQKRVIANNNHHHVSGLERERIMALRLTLMKSENECLALRLQQRDLALENEKLKEDLRALRRSAIHFRDRTSENYFSEFASLWNVTFPPSSDQAYHDITSERRNAVPDCLEEECCGFVLGSCAENRAVRRINDGYSAFYNWV